MHYAKNDDVPDPQTERDEVADILLNLSENGEKNRLNELFPTPNDLKEHTSNEFYDTCVKLNERKSPNRKEHVVHCVQNKHMSISEPSTRRLLSMYIENMPKMSSQ